ncbi:endonuclease/exonuclease/phosphatase family protein [Chitinophaga parva]|uniref:endonuclease/exonuclease/phosphatase family protein n=1 Tax=Chitinophaga parva TaxID=2169414 RepID=UPI0010572FD3|nr:endonuclease/exonuclease/phosphatase family protein [Chitinophaga parva]
MRLLRLFTKGFFLVINVIVAVLFLITCLAPILSPARFWPIGFLTLGFPFLLALLIIFLVGWLFFNARYALLPLIALLLGWKSVSAYIAFHWPTGDAVSDSVTDSSLTVMSYNVAQFGLYREKDSRYTRQAIYALIKKQAPDILCLQDFFTSDKNNDTNNRENISQELQMPYRYFSSDFNRNGNLHWGSIIYSRYPIINSSKIKMSEGPLSESLVYADIAREGDTIRILNMHLQSYRFDQKDYSQLDKIKSQEDTGLKATRNILEKMRAAMVRRGHQADTVASFIRRSPYRVIVCGDFNDIPASYTYFTIRGPLQDAFLEKGSGIGRTFASLSPTLRIDYIFADPTFKVLAYRKIKSNLSDHYPVIAYLR